eukprot:CAMPEP_0176278840 /NCGR_PEP_ID=MMETSP0121_2-20121125/48986_1 /TAXON_ID=160619 /ORGANISM="Kryptoperidinium foliaceum, Strain CCMP 1326" /LENGTH=66 /DNA_ID=CAMNT_0017619155 /DNA_START=280 /DNA_END=477 /DNA_ORIENTATION=+
MAELIVAYSCTGRRQAAAADWPGRAAAPGLGTSRGLGGATSFSDWWLGHHLAPLMFMLRACLSCVA